MVRVMPENDRVVRLEYTSRFTGTSTALLIYHLRHWSEGGVMI